MYKYYNNDDEFNSKILIILILAAHKTLRMSLMYTSSIVIAKTPKKYQSFSFDYMFLIILAIETR